MSASGVSGNNASLDSFPFSLGSVELTEGGGTRGCRPARRSRENLGGSFEGGPQPSFACATTGLGAGWYLAGTLLFAREQVVRPEQNPETGEAHPARP